MLGGWIWIESVFISSYLLFFVYGRLVVALAFNLEMLARLLYKLPLATWITDCGLGRTLLLG